MKSDNPSDATVTKAAAIIPYFGIRSIFNIKLNASVPNDTQTTSFKYLSVERRATVAGVCINISGIVRAKIWMTKIDS